MKDYLRKGVSLDELWKVARGEIKYADFAHKAHENGAARPTTQTTHVPDELVSGQRPPASKGFRRIERSHTGWGTSVSRTGEIQVSVISAS